MRTALHDAVARFGAREPELGRLVRPLEPRGPVASDVPVVLRRCAVRMMTAQLGEGPRSTHAGPRERNDATPIRNAFVPGHRREPRLATVLALARSVTPPFLPVAPAADRSTTCWTMRHDTRSDHSRNSRSPRGWCAATAPNQLLLVRLSSDPRDARNRQPVAMAGVHPLTPLARPPLAWGLGPARGCEQRASRARRLAAPGRRAPWLATTVLDDENTRRSGANESRGAAICSKENPGSISPGHLASPIGCTRRRNPTWANTGGPRPSRRRRAPRRART